MIDYFEDDKSLHGKLIEVVIQLWARKTLFEQYEDVAREKLIEMLKSLGFNTDVTWNISENLLAVSGDVSYLDENNIIRNINFTIMATKTIAKESDI